MEDQQQQQQQNQQEQQEKEKQDIYQYIRPKNPIQNWKKSKKLAWEFFGTAIFAYGICASTNDVFISFSLFAALIIVSPFSGGHLNTAVSFAFFIKGELGPVDFIFRAIGQLFGAFIGAFVSFLVINKINGPSMQGFENKWEDGETVSYETFGIYHAIAGEALATFMFCFFVLLMTDKRTTLLEQSQSSIVTLGTIVLGFHVSRSFTPRTGGGINPAVGASLTAWRAIYSGDTSVLIPMWIYILAPFVGSFFAGLYYNWVHYPLACNKNMREEGARRWSQMMENTRAINNNSNNNSNIRKQDDVVGQPNDIELQPKDLKQPLIDNQDDDAYAYQQSQQQQQQN